MWTGITARQRGDMGEGYAFQALPAVSGLAGLFVTIASLVSLLV